MGLIQLPESCNIQRPKFYTVKLHECITNKGSTADNEARKNTYEFIKAQDRGWYIFKCRYCEKDAKMVDSSYPYFNEYTACEDHAKELFNVIIEE